MPSRGARASRWTSRWPGRWPGRRAEQPTPARPVLSLATPVLLGGPGAGLVLQVPRGVPELDPALVRMQAFPPEPERFVGRAQAMARAGAVLAPGSGQAGVLLHGMAGSGKTASALELAYRHQDSFAAAAFWQAPLADDEFGGALASLAAQLEVQLGEFGFAMSDKITTIESLAAFTPRLRQAAGRCRDPASAGQPGNPADPGRDLAGSRAGNR